MRTQREAGSQDDPRGLGYRVHGRPRHGHLRGQKVHFPLVLVEVLVEVRPGALFLWFLIYSSNAFYVTL